MNKWNSFPEWVRWILCWPIIVILTLLVGLITMILASIALDRIGISKAVAEILYPAIVTLINGPVFFFLIHQFVPRKQIWVTGFFVFVSTTLGIMAAIRWYLEITEKIATDILLQDMVQTITAVGVSWFWFFYFKNKYAEGTNLHDKLSEK